ncbi:MAG: alpha/beta fold hydrolase [Spirochaetota bacterium]
MKDEKIDFNGYQCRMISHHGEGPCIVLLHGLMFTSDVWNDIGLLHKLVKHNIPFKAVDMPYGQKSQCVPKTNDPGINMGIVARATPNDAVLIGASLGGYLALRHGVANQVAGLLLIAPAMSLQKELSAHYDRMRTKKVSLIYGEADPVVPLEEMKELSRQLNAELKIYEKARHAAYLDHPERFNNDVIEFYNQVIAR